MGLCFSSPSKKELLQDSRELVEENARILSVCKEIAGELAEEVGAAYDAVRYMIPSQAAGAAHADKKINALCGDLKIALSKSGGRGVSQAKDLLAELKAAVAERNSFNK